MPYGIAYSLLHSIKGVFFFKWVVVVTAVVCLLIFAVSGGETKIAEKTFYICQLCM